MKKSLIYYQQNEKLTFYKKRNFIRFKNMVFILKTRSRLA